MKKVPDFLRNQELFGRGCRTRTSDLLRVKQSDAPAALENARFFKGCEYDTLT